MLHPKLVSRIESLLAEGNLSITKIAQKMRVSRGSVSAIAHGKRRLKYHQKKMPIFYDFAFDNQGNKIYYPTDVIDRCPECGCLVRLPCLACQLQHSIKYDKNNKSMI